MENNKIRKPILQIIFVMLFPLFLIGWLFNDEPLKEMFKEWGEVLDPVPF